MAMFEDQPQRPAAYERFVHEVPAWFRDAKLGIFVHWGAYSVPAWAEPVGELGTLDDEYWFAHCPYAEWYANTIRIDGSPAQRHHEQVWDGRPYDDFLDLWRAEDFDPAEQAALFARAGARYLVPTTKHHDGITLWDAPGTDGRNTVARGPRRDLVGAYADAARRAGLRFGTYYSGGLDWHVRDLGPITRGLDGIAQKPVDEEYTAYANAHLLDLVERYRPDLLWGDIDWPDAGKPEGPLSFTHVLDAFYAANPEGVVNDRFGLTHWDFRTSEYQQGRSAESDDAWENCRGIGFSFGYNQVEGPEHHLDGPAAVRHLLDVVSRGGNLLLDVGPDAAGRIPPLQRACLEQLGDWMERHGDAVHGTRPLDAAVARPTHDGDDREGPWLRWTASADHRTAYGVVDTGAGGVRLTADPDRVDPAGARLLDGTPVPAAADGGAVHVTLPQPVVPGPQVVALPVR